MADCDVIAATWRPHHEGSPMDALALERAIIARRAAADGADARIDRTYHARGRVAADLGSPVVADRWIARTHADGARFAASPATHAEYDAVVLAPTCGAQYGDPDGRPIALQGSAGWRVPTCDLAPDHGGDSHEDHVLDAPATIAWRIAR